MMLPLALTLALFPLADAGGRTPQDDPVVGVRAAVPEPAQPLVLRVHDVSALLGVERLELLLADLGDRDDPTQVQSALARLERHATLSEQVTERRTTLVEGIRSFLEPPLQGDQRLVDLGDGRLALFGTPQQQRWTAGFLAAAHALDGMVDVRTEIVRLPKGSLRTLGVERTGSSLDATRAEELRVALERLQVDRISAPRILVHPLQPANLFAGEQIAYIKDYELQVLGDHEIADPVIGVLQAGIELDVRVALLGDGRLGVDLELGLSDLVELREYETPLGASGTKITVQLPELKTLRATSRLYLRPGDTALLASVDEEGEDEVLVLIGAELVELPDSDLDGPQDPLPGALPGVGRQR